MRDSLLVFSGNANRLLADRICEYLNIPLGNTEIQYFPDGEFDVKLLEDVRGADVYVIQPTCPPVNENILQLLILIDALKRASAGQITAVIPYFGYARQDRKAEGRVPITAKLVANMVTASGADRVLSMDLHAAQIQGFFDIPMDHLYAAPVVIEYFRRLELTRLTVMSPDVGGVKMARAYAKRLNADLAIVDKRRSGPEQVEAMHVIGAVKGRNVMLVDDIISTATTISEAAAAAKREGARDVYVCATHPVLCGDAVRKLAGAPLKEVIVTDTIPIAEEKAKKLPNLRVLTVSNLIGEAIRRIHKSESVSSLFI
jgi:ribose-phosphate pyrophosphokinase